MRALGITKRYRAGPAAVTALNNVTMAVPSGRFTAIMGPSGSGKSTLLHCLAGLDTADSGRVYLGEIDLTDALRTRADPAAPGPGRVRVPVVQPAAGADRGGEYGAAAADRRPRAGPELDATA